MRPHDESNFLIEVTPNVMDKIHQLLSEEDDNSIELHYSPYWDWEGHLKRVRNRGVQPKEQQGEGDSNAERN